MPLIVHDPLCFKVGIMETGQIIYLWKLVYWRAIGEGKEPWRAAEIANQHVAVQKHALAAMDSSPACA